MVRVGVVFWRARADLMNVRQKSIELCQQRTGETCDIVMENFEPIDASARIETVDHKQNGTSAGTSAR